ncbi:exopolysaccharide production protein [Frigoribacterium sp. ACAM 257]|uniref:exopolysaccharide production protein n=1 Tax=Frigoribacterium sp. ACAM 257 TaxID=2508998 RepID=UPI0011B9D056|nr:exopolysaccharide production protein [Frigoribacterium sp. ACAM 257]TWX40284.1 exopolysaccharide production protein [Frigoribacterium sp. ACAM 257]
MGSPGGAHEPVRRYVSAWIGFSAGGHFSQALAVAVVVYAFSAHAVRALIGWPGSLAVLVSLVALAACSLFGQRRHIEWHGILPVSLIALFGWWAVSVFWSDYTWATIGGVAYAVAFGALGLYLALGRDLVQVVRASGDALRILLVTSLALEVLSGLLIDQPIRFLGIAGDLALGGPIQGIAGTRNYLGFLAAFGLVTFAVEYLTRSVAKGLGLASCTLAALCVLFSRSPVTAAAVLALVVAGLALRSLRKAPPTRRPLIQGALAGIVSLGGVVAWLSREQIFPAVDATGDVDVRIALWARLRQLIEVNSLQGWGFVGQWPTEVFPFSTLLTPAGRPSATGLGALFDTWFQVGLVGVLLLAAAGGLAFVRAWTTASSHPIVAYVWPALVLVLIAVVSIAESYALFEGTLMLVVATSAIAARKRSWRSRLEARPTAQFR